MLKFLSFRFIMLITFFTSTLSYSSINTALDNQVIEWTKSVLIDTLSFTYNEKPSEIKAVQKYYSLAAWEPMNSFFNKEIKIVELYKLTLHPIALNKPTLVKESICSDKPCWRVDQSYKIPELGMSINFSLLIHLAMNTNSRGFLIQSINMTVHHY